MSSTGRTPHRHLPAAGLTKSAAFRGSQRDVGVDERVAVAFNIQGASVADILRLAYPSLYALHDPQRAVAGAEASLNVAGRIVAVHLSVL
jgi:hypothetical protein